MEIASDCEYAYSMTVRRIKKDYCSNSVFGNEYGQSGVLESTVDIFGWLLISCGISGADIRENSTIEINVNAQNVCQIFQVYSSVSSLSYLWLMILHYVCEGQSLGVAALSFDKNSKGTLVF